LGKHLLSNGKKIGFFKPVIANNKNSPAENTDSDTAFIKHLFDLEEPIDLLCPVFSNESDMTNRIRKAYDRVSRGKDVVLMEGVSDQSQASHGILETLDARVIIVEGYSKDLINAINSYKDFGKYLLGVVLNKVPINRVEHVHGEMSTKLTKAGISTLGALPEDRTLLAPTIDELSERIQGKILSGAEKSAELVENIMLGAMGVDPGPQYFNSKNNKAVVVRSERPDMQLAALETSTRCLVLTGNTAPNPAVVCRAEEINVPIILARDDITTIVTNVGDTLGKTRFNQENKLPKLTEIMGQHFGFQAVYKGLGLAD